jgi:hypothetical protein
MYYVAGSIVKRRNVPATRGAMVLEEVFRRKLDAPACTTT